MIKGAVFPATRKDVVIIGAGAAGLMCAIEAGKRKRSVVILEHMNRSGKKIRVAGGGRCNFTNINVKAENYFSNNPHFSKSALARFRPEDFISIMEKHGIKYFKKEKGQLFCSSSSADIVNMLNEECRLAGVDMYFNCIIRDVKKNSLFSILTDSGRIEAESLVVSTGGLSCRELGATDIGFSIARTFGLKVTGLKPALAPFVFNKDDVSKYGELSGISFEASVFCKNKKFNGKVLFTHNGLSGPAILQASLYWEKGDEIVIDLLPEQDVYELLMFRHGSKTELSNFLSEYVPKRFIQKWCSYNTPSKPLCRYTEKELKDIANRIHRWVIAPEKTEGFGRAEVTAGGVDTDELSSKTMESKKVPGLFFIGEVVDVTGQLGGYNLHWAWASGFAAGRYV